MFKTLATASVLIMSAGAAWAAPTVMALGSDLSGSASVALVGSALVAAGMVIRRRTGFEA